MRIVIDMQGAQTESRFRGVGRYTMSFAQAVVRNKGEHEIVLALSGLFPDTIEPIRAAFDGLLPQENICVWYAPGPVQEEISENTGRRGVAELLREAFLSSLRPDIIHVSSLFEGYVDDGVTSICRFKTGTPVSVILYDVIPLLNPDRYFKSNPDYERFYLRKTEHLRNASICFAISACTMEEGSRVLGLEKSKILNISSATSPEFQPHRIDEAIANRIRQKFNLRQAFVLYSGGADERKNLPRLIQAYAALPEHLRDRYQLVFSGDMPESRIAQFKNVARAHGLKASELIFTGYVTDEELVQLYNLCQLFIFPSWHEGFGLPALEAMACGAPVIGANVSSLPEVIGLPEAMFDPFDVASISEKMKQALEDEVFRTRMREHGVRQAKKFSWDETAKRAIGAWENLYKQNNLYASTKAQAFYKPTMAFISPLPPARTGIADYSAVLFLELSAYYDIELVVAQDQVDISSLNQCVKIRDVAWLRANFKKIDRVLYHVGNSPFHSHMVSLLAEIPGVVVLHDFFLGHLLAGMELQGHSNIWKQSLYESHGYASIKEACLDPEVAKFKYPANWNILQQSLGVIVHSNYAASLANLWYSNAITADLAVIPLLRLSAQKIDKRSARKELGINEDSFVVCSFGLLDKNKLNHRLLRAWQDSALGDDNSCHLIFVGECHKGQYRESLLQEMHELDLDRKIHITGFVNPEMYCKYLAAADVAVQLRANSRGETSAAVLDCMNYALPVIVNGNGSMAELDHATVWMLDDEFSDASLVEALEVLWREPERRQTLSALAKAVTHDHHAPAKCAKEYFVAIERFYQTAVTQAPALLNAIGKQETFLPCESELINLSQAIASNLPLRQPERRLFLDVSIICRQDIKTGIQRVTRAIIMELLELSPSGYRVEPVYLCDEGGVWHYRFAQQYTFDLLQCQVNAVADTPIDPQNGDILLLLDLTGSMMISAADARLYDAYRSHGVRCFAVVYDLLPVLLPDVFPQGSSEAHECWLKKVSELDGAVCISRAVAKELKEWQEQSAIIHENRRPFSIDWFHLGADVSNSAPSKGLPLDANMTLQQFSSRPTFLMVGTIEPRKGYLQAIEAFSELWSDNVDINLVIVGREGWKGWMPDEHRRNIPETVLRLRNHRECNKRLFWLEGISDEYLEKVYANSTCLIAASYGEGFGLPLIEAAQHKLPIIARDIPVFREVAGKYAYYFSESTPDGLAQAINEWLALYKNDRYPKSDYMPCLTWKESAQQLLRGVLRSE